LRSKTLRSVHAHEKIWRLRGGLGSVDLSTLLPAFVPDLLTRVLPPAKRNEP
jgi:hypothetical protein